MSFNHPNHPEIIIGLVAPIGSVLTLFTGPLQEESLKFGYELREIKMTELLEKELAKLSLPREELSKIKKIKSLYTFFKMEACTAFRKEKGHGYFAGLAIREIQKIRKENPNKKIIYLINQLKNLAEHEILTRIYGENYIQVSCFSNEQVRSDFLRIKFNNEKPHHSAAEALAKKYIQKISKDFKFNYQDIQDNLVYKLMIKDHVELPDAINTQPNHKTSEKDQNSNGKEPGQSIAKLFDKSHFFVNLDQPTSNVQAQTRKFTELIFGIHQEYPTPEEYGMAIAYVVSKRSNFPGERHVGACMTSIFGEIIATGSIRAPMSNANPTRASEGSIQEGYHTYKKQLTHFEDLVEQSDISAGEKRELAQFVHNSMEFHPCTHAEISAISDAAKLGISTRNAILYSTTFPCHMCAKDIISTGIARVVFLEAFPKSKNKELYSKLIEIDPIKETKGKIAFHTFCGVGPRKYNYFYSLDNKQKDDTNQHSLVPPLLKYRLAYVYQTLESQVVRHLEGSLPENQWDEIVREFLI